MKFEEKIIFGSSVFFMGVFRCPPWGSAWNEENRSGKNPLFVFPRVPVEIRQFDREPVLATPNEVVLYNPFQPYLRKAVDPRGDNCEFIGVNFSVLKEAIEFYSGRQLPEGKELEHCEFFNTSNIRCEATTFLLQRMLMQKATEEAGQQLSEMEDAFFDLLPRLINSMQIESSSASRTPDVSTSQEQVWTAREIIGKRFRSSLSVESIANEIDCSVFHLCRRFKELNSISIYQFIKRTRLLSSLEEVCESNAGLSEIALEYQFSSHSHFTSAFRRQFGITPSALRKNPSLMRIRNLG